MPKSFLVPLLLSALLFGFSPVTAGHAQTAGWSNDEPRINKIWTVTDHAGEKWRLNPESMLGKSQNFKKDWAKGSFFDCPYGGLSSTTTAYPLADFLENREFRPFALHQAALALFEPTVFVHRISCARGLRVLYPFVTFEPTGRAMLLFEGVVYVLE